MNKYKVELLDAKAGIQKPNYLFGNVQQKANK